MVNRGAAMKKNRRVLVVLVLVLACAARIPWQGRDHVEKVISEAEKDAVPPILDQPWGEGREQHVGKVQALHGANQERVQAELGEPNLTYEFPVDEAPGEFRVELHNSYRVGHLKSRGVRIREWQWWYKDFRFAVWFHKVDGGWVVLDTCRWRNVVF